MLPSQCSVHPGAGAGVVGVRGRGSDYKANAQGESFRISWCLGLGPGGSVLGHPAWLAQGLVPEEGRECLGLGGACTAGRDWCLCGTAPPAGLHLAPEPPLPALQAELFPAALVHFGAEEPAGEWDPLFTTSPRVPEQGLPLGLERKPVV